MVSTCVGHFELKILSEFKINDRVSPRSNWQITEYIVLIGLDGWMGGWVDGWMVEPG